MAFCRFCGKQIPDGGSCDCSASKAAAEVKETAEKTATVQLDSPVKCMYRQEWVSGLLGIKDED